MRGVLILAVISFSLLGVFAKKDSGDVKQPADKENEGHESTVRETAVFAPQKLKSGRLTSRQDKEIENGVVGDSNHRGDMATAQAQHSAVVQVQEIHGGEGHGNSEEQVPQSYKFGYEVKDQYHGHQFRHEQKDPQGTIHGRFGYRDKEGQYRQVDYVADDHGFRASVKTNEFGVENQNPADVAIEKNQHNIHYEQPPPSKNSHSEEVEHRLHPEYHAKSAEEGAVPHTDSSVHPDASQEVGYEDQSHEELPHKNYQRGSETGHHPITLRPGEKYSYLPQRPMQPAYHPSSQIEELHRKAPLGRRPLYDTAEYHSQTVQYSQPHPSHPEKKDSYLLGSKGKAASAIVSRHFYKKHLTHHQHVVQHPPQKVKTAAHEQPQSLHYQQLSRGLSARVVPSSPEKHQHQGEGSYEIHGKDALRISPHGETYHDAPQHYIQAEHPASRERQQSGEYEHQAEYLPQKVYHSHHPNANGDSAEHSGEGVPYSDEGDKDYHKYANNGHGNNHRDQSQEYVNEQNLRYYSPNPQSADYHGPRDKEYQTSQHSNDVPVNKVQHVVFKVPFHGRELPDEHRVQLKGNGEDQRVYVHPAEPSTHPQNYGDHNSPVAPQSHLNGGKVHFPDVQPHPGYTADKTSGYGADKTVYIPEQYQNGYEIVNGPDASTQGYQTDHGGNHHQRSPSLQTSYQNVPHPEHHSNGNSAVGNGHNVHYTSSEQPVQYLQETKQQPDYGNDKEYVQKVVYNGNNVQKHQLVNIPAISHAQYEGSSKSEETPHAFHQSEMQQIRHDQQVHQIPVQYHQMVKLDPEVYNQLINTASLSPNKVVALPIIKQLGNGNTGKLFIVGASHEVTDGNRRHHAQQKVVQQVSVLVPPGQKHPTFYEGGTNGKILLPQDHSKSDISLHSQEGIANLPVQSYDQGKHNSPRRSSRGGHKKLIFYATQNGQFAKKPDSENRYQIHADSGEQSSLKSAGQTLYDQYKSVSGSLGKEEPRVSTTSKSKWIPIRGPPHRQHKLSGRHLKGDAHDTYTAPYGPPLYPAGTASLLNGPGSEKAHYNNKYSQQVLDHASNYGSPINLSQYEAEQGLHGQISYAPSNKIFFKKSCNCIVKNGKIIRNV